MSESLLSPDEIQALLGDTDNLLDEADAVQSTRDGAGLGVLLGVPLQLTVELGEVSIPIREILSLSPGSIVNLDKMSGEPVDVRVNGTLIARGEVVTVEEHLAVRITEIVGSQEHV